MLNLRAARVLFVAAAAIALYALVYALASAPSRVASRLGMRGLKRRRAIEDSAAAIRKRADIPNTPCVIGPVVSRADSVHSGSYPVAVK